MQSTISEYCISEAGNIRLYITGTEELSSAEELRVLAGTEECPVTGQGKVQGSDGFRTLLMVDNSNSIKDFERCRELVRSIISGHTDGEMFRLVTFDSELTAVTEEADRYSSDYEMLDRAAQSITKEDRSTDTVNALMQALQQTRDEEGFTRIILISDGGDIAGSGTVTPEEVGEMLQESPVLLHCIGVLWDSKDAEGLRSMAVLGRKYGSFDLLDAEGAEQTILEKVRADYNAMYLEADLPQSVLDGSTKSICAEFLSAGNSYHISKDIRMPQKALPTAEPSPSPTPEPTATPAPEPIVTESHNESKTEYIARVIQEMPLSGMPAIFGCTAAAVCLAVIAFLLLRRRRPGKNKEEERDIMPDIPDFENTEIYVERSDEGEEESFETQMMFGRPEPEKNITVILTDTSDRDNVLKTNISDTVTLGSSEKQNALVLKKDPTVSRTHARLTNREGRILLEDLASTNGTWLNRSKVKEALEIRTGDLLRFGNTEMTVRVEAGEAT